jgi:3-keto-5-aminohexanoate cleavage enzyme
MMPTIVEVAINGSTTKKRNPFVPINAEEIAADALTCFESGASMVHNHIADLKATGNSAAEQYLQGWRPVVVQRPDALLYSTVAMAPTPEARFAHYTALANSGLTAIGALDTGSVNLWAADAQGLPCEPSFNYVNTFVEIAHCISVLDASRLAPSIAIFEPGWLRPVLAYHAAGRLPKGAFVKFYFGGLYNLFTNKPGHVTFGFPPTARSLDAYLDMMNGCDLPWAVAVLGGDVVETGMARLAMERGGHVRVGLEDFGGPRTPSNAELVREVADLAEKCGRPLATPTQAAELLELPRRRPEGSNAVDCGGRRIVSIVGDSHAGS